MMNVLFSQHLWYIQKGGVLHSASVSRKSMEEQGETPRWGFPSLIAPQSNSPFPAFGKEKGVSLSADSDGGLCPLNPCKLLKKA